MCPRWDKRAETECYHDLILSVRIKGLNISLYEPKMIQECLQSLSSRNPLSFSPIASGNRLQTIQKKNHNFRWSSGVMLVIIGEFHILLVWNKRSNKPID